MTSRSRKSLLALIVTGLVGALVFVGYRPHPLAVDLAKVTRGPLVVTTNADGKTRVRSLYEVSAPISGTALRSPVEEGALVVAGETVVAKVKPVTPALIDARTRLQLEAGVLEAEAAARLAAAQHVQAVEEHAFALREVERTKALVERGVSSETSLESAMQVLKLRLSALGAAASNVDMANSSLARTQAALIDPTSSNGAGSVALKAPASGTVLAVSQVSEHAVTVGMPLVTIGAVNDLEIEADLLSSDAVRMSVGARAIVERWGGEPPLEARLTSLSPRAQTQVSSLGVEEQRVSAVFDLITPSEARAGLGHQFAVFLRIVTWENDDVLRAPLSALFRDGDGWAVFVVDGGSARLTTVETGARSDDMVEIISGIEEGNLVITHPSDDVSDEAMIVDREAL